MLSLETLFNQPKNRFRLALVALLLISLALRFWGLGRFNMLVFDEVYYVQFANNYLNSVPFFDGHPPLSKYLIAAGIWLGNQLPFGQDTVNELAGSPLSTFSYRWLNAVTGSLIPLVVAGLAYQLSHRRSYALIAGFFTAMDGLLLVESRYALNNVYLLLFGLLGHWLLFLGLEKHTKRRLLWLTLSGICFGGSIAIKWNGLWFLLGAYGIWFLAWVVRIFSGSWGDQDNANAEDLVFIWASERRQLPIQRLTQLNLPMVVFFLGVIPVVFYSLTWIPHLQINPDQQFIEVHQRLLNYHEGIAGMTPFKDPNCTPWLRSFLPSRHQLPICVPEVHPYCSTWYTWLLMLRPVVYLYETARSVSETVPVKPDLAWEEVKVIYDVHAMGNPILWWASTVAIVAISIAFISPTWQNRTKKFAPSDRLRIATEEETIPPPRQFTNRSLPNLANADRWIIAYILINYGANLLPWVRVTRCIFLYHYMGASLFATLALTWFCDRWLHHPQQTHRLAFINLMVLIVLAFIFWLPLYLGLPLAPDAMPRRWLPTW